MLFRSFNKLKDLFPEVEYSQKTNRTTHTVDQHPAKPVLKKSRIKITETAKQLIVSLPKNEVDSQFLRSFRFYRWDQTNLVWIIPNWKNNSELLKSYFKDRAVEYEVKENIRIQADDFLPEFTPEQMLVVNHAFRQLKVYLAFRKHLVESFRKLPLCSWNRTERCWTMPYAEKFINELRIIANNYGLEFAYQQQQSGKLRPRISRFDIQNYRNCPAEFTDKLKELQIGRAHV